MQTENAASDAPVHPMSEYEKFLFDLKGFLVIPGVLTDEETRTVREHTEILLQDPESLPEHHRAPIAGPAEFLIDHPRVMGLLQGVLAPEREHIRLESVFVSSRSAESIAKTRGGPTWAGPTSIPRYPTAITTAASTAG